MFTRNPYQRCGEINISSTGDFIWEVAHLFALTLAFHSKHSIIRNCPPRKLVKQGNREI